MGFSFNPFTGNLDLVGSGSSSTPTGTPSTIAWFDSLGALGSIPGWAVDDLGYWSNIVSIGSGDTRANFAQIAVQTNLVGTITSTARAAQFVLSGGANPIANIIAHELNVTADVDTNMVLAGFYGAGSAGNDSTGLDVSLNVDTTNVMRLLNLNSDGAVAAFYGLNIYDQTDSSGPSMLINVHSQNPATAGRVQMVVSNAGNVSGGDFTAFSHYNNGTLSGFGNGVQASQNGDVTKGYVGFNSYLNANMGDGSGVNYTAYLGGTAPGKVIDGGVFGFAMNYQADVQGQIVGMSLYNSGDYEGFSGLLINNTGSVVGNNSFYVINATQNAAGYSALGCALFVNQNQTEEIRGYSLNTNADSRTLTGIDLYLDGNATDDVRALRINMANQTSTNARPLSLDITGGLMTIAGQWVPRSAMTVEVGDYVANFATISSPLTGSDVIAQIHQPTLTANDNMSIGPLGLGWVMHGIVPQISVASGKTIPMLRAALIGANIPSGSGGTVTEYVGIEVLGLPSAGGTVTNPTRIGIQDSTLLGQDFSDGAGADVWFLRVRDTVAENYLGKSLAIGTSTMKVSNSDVAFEIGSLKALRHAQLTTAQRDALTPLGGMMIYNTTTDDVEYYANGAWQGHVSNVDGGSAGTSYGASLSIDGGAA